MTAADAFLQTTKEDHQGHFVQIKYVSFFLFEMSKKKKNTLDALIDPMSGLSKKVIRVTSNIRKVNGSSRIAERSLITFQFID